MPTAWKLSPHGQEKRILKEAFAGMLPTAILERAKQPYRAPDAAPFLGAEAPDYLELLLSARELQRLELIDDTVAIPFVQKLRRTAPERISQRENQAFLFLLSLALLQYQLVEGRGAAGVTGQIGDWAPAAIAGLLVRWIDGRAMVRGDGREEAGRTTGYP
jgi:asparagine synthase (glutamine-hydrolysing)